MKKHPVNREIASTYFKSGRKQTLVAILGVLLGMAVYMFMNSMNKGFNRAANESFFKMTAHLRIYSDDVLSKPIAKDTSSEALIINPGITPSSNRIVNPQELVALIKKQADVSVVVPQVTTSVFYNNGKSQLAGRTVGFIPSEGEKLFNIKGFMVQGNYDDLERVPNSVIIGAGIASKMSVETGDKMSVTSPKGVQRLMTIVGIFKTSNSYEDRSKSYMSLHSAQQLLQEGGSFVTDINVNFTDFNMAMDRAQFFSELSGYKAEDWQTANATFVAASKMRTIVITFVSLTLLVVSCFGIYTILNMTVSQKINDIAIMKAMGFEGKDVVRIFVYQALTIGVIGVILGIIVAIILIHFLQKVYIGGDIGYFPIRFEPWVFLRGTLIGMGITFLAGFIPARKAAKVDPVAIFRK
ncbi:MAG: ABC transporter permease [Bacteroidia bacterium]|jgi:lipoprotein-releasing system permease protein